MNHTPGPWRAEDQKTEEPLILADGLFIALVGNDDVGYMEETWANSQLISAAPEMLQSLKEVLSLAKEWGKDPKYYTQAEKNVIGFAEDAIAKAEGK